MGVGCVVVARERPTTRDGVVVATTARLMGTSSAYHNRADLLGSALL